MSKLGKSTTVKFTDRGRKTDSLQPGEGTKGVYLTDSHLESRSNARLESPISDTSPDALSPIAPVRARGLDPVLLRAPGCLCVCSISKRFDSQLAALVVGGLWFSGINSEGQRSWWTAWVVVPALNRKRND
jgi:hypothetical protein